MPKESANTAVITANISFLNNFFILNAPYLSAASGAFATATPFPPQYYMPLHGYCSLRSQQPFMPSNDTCNQWELNYVKKYVKVGMIIAITNMAIMTADIRRWVFLLLKLNITLCLLNWCGADETSAVCRCGSDIQNHILLKL